MTFLIKIGYAPTDVYVLYTNENGKLTVLNLLVTIGFV